MARSAGKPGQRYALIPTDWLESGDLSAPDIAVLCALASYADAEGVCWPAIATLADRAGLSDRSARRSLARLSTLGYLEWDQRRRSDGTRSSSLYRLTDRPTARVAASPTAKSASANGQGGRAEVEPREHNQYTPTDVGVASNVIEIIDQPKPNGGAIVAAYVDEYRQTHDGSDPLDTGRLAKLVGAALRGRNDPPVVTRAAQAAAADEFGAAAFAKHLARLTATRASPAAEPRGFAGIRDYLRRSDDAEARDGHGDGVPQRLLPEAGG